MVARYPVSVNRASQQELEVLPYVGPALAQKIVAYRARFGPFRRLDDLLAVQGVGPRTLQRIAPYVSL
jgi:competence protein ComEA